MEDSDLITSWGFVVEGYAAAQRILEADLADTGLPMVWFEVLLRLVRSPGHRLPMTQLANEVSFSSGGFTKLADRLEMAGNVTRVACAQDRRVTWITLTEHGAQVISSASVRHVESLRATILGPLGEVALRELGGHMRTLRDSCAH